MKVSLKSVNTFRGSDAPWSRRKRLTQPTQRLINAELKVFAKVSLPRALT